MASPYSFYDRNTRRILKECTDYANNVCDALGSKDSWQIQFDACFEIEMGKLEKQLDLMSRIHDRIGDKFNEVLGKISGTDNSPSGFFITIRPDDTKCQFVDFRDKVFKLLERACFKEYALSFEQKGTTPEDLGKGFHCHIVAKMKQRSKGEVLRDVTSSFKSWIDDGLIAANCIDVHVTKNPEELVKNYLLEYKSDDDHKATTKSWDELWRAHNDIKPIYAQKLLESP